MAVHMRQAAIALCLKVGAVPHLYFFFSISDGKASAYGQISMRL